MKNIDEGGFFLIIDQLEEIDDQISQLPQPDDHQSLTQACTLGMYVQYLYQLIRSKKSPQ